MLPLLFPPRRPAGGPPRPHIRRSRNPRDPRRAHRLRRVSHQRRIASDLRAYGRTCDRVRTRRFPITGRSVPRRAGAELHRITLVPRRRRLFRRRAGSFTGVKRRDLEKFGAGWKVRSFVVVLWRIENLLCHSFGFLRSEANCLGFSSVTFCLISRDYVIKLMQFI